MRLLLDTDIVIDMLRRYTPAMDWFRGRADDVTLAISGFSEFELVTGCRDQIELDRLGKLLAGFDVLWLNPSECVIALDRYRRDRLRHGARMIDTLVAQTALTFDVPLHTFNVRHYRYIPDIRVIAPYSRL